MNQFKDIEAFAKMIKEYFEVPDEDWKVGLSNELANYVEKKVTCKVSMLNEKGKVTETATLREFNREEFLKLCGVEK